MLRKPLAALLTVLLALMSFGGVTGVLAADVPTITLELLVGTTPTETASIEAAISEITREKYGFNVEIITIEIGNWQTQLNLLLSGGDDTLDVYWGGYVLPYNTIVSNGQALPLDDLMAPYADEMKAALTERVFESGRVDGILYGIGRLLDQASSPTYNLRADVAAEFGLKNGDHITMDQLNELFANIRAKYPDTPLVGPFNNSVNLGDGRVDGLGNANMLGVLGDYGQDTTVINYYESDYYASMVEDFKKWKELNAFMPDFLNVTEQPVDYIPAGKAFGNFAGHFNAEMNGIWASQNFGVDMASFFIFDNAVAVTPGAYYCINPACKNPDKAAALIYLMATDSDIVNLLALGIEGQDYRILDDGSAAYLEGKNVSNTGWAMGYSWTALNSTISTPFNYPANYFDLMVEANANAMASKAFGFQFDASSVSDAITACTNVVSQYRQAIACGAVEDIDAAVAEFQQALRDAGIDDIIAAKQAQLDAFLASK